MTWQSSQSCVPCGSYNQSTYHHILTRKAHPEHENKKWNLIPVCKSCHTLWHLKGTEFMSKKFPSVKEWLIDNKWEVEELRDKWVRYD